jgi:hypothetical protein
MDYTIKIGRNQTPGALYALGEGVVDGATHR